MLTYLSALLLALFPVFLWAQTSLSGVINQYAKVTAIDYCDGQLSVANATNFEVGDRVLLIQMKGAQINTSNSGSFGNINELGAAGLFEKNEIIAKSGNEMILKNTLLNVYSTAGAVQLVTVPVYENATVTGLLTATLWNGETGGVLVFEVENDLVLEAGMDVSGAGFRGGAVNVVNSGCNFLTNANDFYYSASDWKGAPKGEGVAALVQNREHGRGAQANGGGGGNDHNAGGGGGANVSSGGNGGRQKSDSAFGCDGDYPGRAGKPLPGEPARIFLGGGGGAGHLDDPGAGSAGGNGGGIILIKANKIIASGQSILANGKTPPQATGDGAGGGGGGGTIYLAANEKEGSLTIESKGGNGGSVSNSSSRCFGPGGGGSGGRLVTNLNNLGTVNLSGGSPGENTVSSGQCDGPSNGAVAGETGLQTNFAIIPTSAEEIVALSVVAQPQASTGCEGIPVAFEFVMQGNAFTYQWQVNNGSGWANLANSSVYSGVQTSVLTISAPTPGLNGFQYRCLVTNPCVTDYASEPATLTMVPAPQPDFTFTSLGNGTFVFTNTSGFADSFVWDFGEGNASNEENPTHTFGDFGVYTVTLTATSACGSSLVTQQITVTTAPGAAFTSDVQTGCVPFSVQYQDLSTDNTENWQWVFPGGDPATSNDQNPMVTYSQPGTYAATLIVSNLEGSDTMTVAQAVVAKGVPSVNFNFAVNGLTVTFTNLSVNAAGGYVWSFGDSETSTAINPVHTYQNEAFFEVSLTALNSCGEAVFTQTVSTGDLPLALFTESSQGGCTPLVVTFQNESSNNVDSYSWSFPGGEPAFSNEENPVVTYPVAGVFDVTLTVTNSLGNHTLTKPGAVVVQQTPMADFFFEIDSLTVSFINFSIGGAYFIWNFGDGTTSGLENPVHTYANNGVYDVNLTAANNTCGSAIAYQVFINTTDVGETWQLPSAMVFPNPAGDVLNVKLAAWPTEQISVKLWDLQGRPRQEFLFQNNHTSLDTSQLPPGLYLLELRAGDETARFKIVKN